MLQADGNCLALALRPMALVCEVEAEWHAQIPPQVSHAPTSEPCTHTHFPDTSLCLFYSEGNERGTGHASSHGHAGKKMESLRVYRGKEASCPKFPWLDKWHALC